MSGNLRVMKFGGTSVGDASRIRAAAEITASAAKRGEVLAVVSAMSGVTNRLVEAEQIIKDAATLCQGTAMLRELTPRALDAISSVGERLSARLMAAALEETGVRAEAVEATEVVVTDDEHGQAEPLMDETRARASERLLPLLAGGVVPVVTGFIGATRGGTLTTLGRGGSDYSATILGAALGASEIIIWTDVPGVMTADPRLVREARTIHDISYAEAAELAYFGAKVLHPKTLR